MKILMTADCVGGVWTYALELSHELAGAGHAVVLAVMGGDLAPDQRAQLEAAPLHAWDAQPFRLEWMAGAQDDLDAAGRWLLDLAAQHRPDVAHLNQFCFASLPWPCPVVSVAHSDVVTWWRAVHGADPGSEWSAYRHRVAAGLAAADVVIAPTASYLRQVCAAYDVSTPSRVIANGRRLTIPVRERQPMIAAAGRVWDAAKNLATAVRAADGLDWPLVVAGDGAPDMMAAQFLGRISAAEVALLLAGAPVFVAPARYEPFGLAALEAGLAGCALVLGDIPTLREVWADAATFVDPDDEDGLRGALQSLIEGPALRSERGSAAAARAAMFEPATMTAAYVDAYGGVLAPAPQAAAR